MRSQSGLPHRFWPKSQLPAGVTVWEKSLNLASADFIKVYNKRVNPRLRALGMTCKGARASRQDGDRVSLGWFAGNKAGGSGSLGFAAHRLGIPSRIHFPVTAAELDFQHCAFFLQVRLFEGPHGTSFDLGKDAAEAAETCGFLLEAIEEQAVPFLSAIGDALGALAALDATELDSKMPDLVTRFHIRVTDSDLTPFAEQRIQLALLVARLAHLDGRRDAVTAWATLGKELLGQAQWPPYAHHTHMILFEKLLAGTPELEITAADRAERDRRMNASA